MKKVARFFFVDHFFATLWSVIGIALIVAGIFFTLRVVHRISRETREMRKVVRVAVRDAHEARRAASALSKDLRERPLQVVFQATSDTGLLTFQTQGSADLIRGDLPVQEK